MEVSRRAGSAHRRRQRLRTPRRDDSVALGDQRQGRQAERRRVHDAAGLVVADKAADLKQGVAQAFAALDSGAAAKVLDQLVAITQGRTP